MIVLDERIDDFATLVKEFYNITELGDPSSVTEVILIDQHLYFITHHTRRERSQSLAELLWIVTQHLLRM